MHALVTLRRADLELDVVPELGMIVPSLRHRGEELLGQRRGLAAYAERGSTMGVPLLHPWANRLGGFTFEAAGRRGVLDPDARFVRTEEHGLPIHGLFAASPDWTVVARDEARLAAELDAGRAGEAILRAFPFPHVLRLEVALEDDGARWTTTLTPTGEVGVPIAFGFHPYLALPGAPREAWELDVPLTRRLVLDDRALPTGEVEEVAPVAGPLGARAFDDAYALDGPTALAVRGGGREVRVSFDEGWTHAQVFAPPGQALVALEPMTAPADALRSGWGLRVAAPGEPFTATFGVTVLA